MRLKIVTQPAVEPVLLTEVLEHCHVDIGIEDNWFTSAIYVARRTAEHIFRASLITQTLQVTYDALLNYIELPMSPVQSVSNIKIYDINNIETNCDTSRFFIDTDIKPAIITLNYSEQWEISQPRERSCLKIEYIAGYGDTGSLIPKDIKMAIFIMIAWMYENRSCEEIPNIPKAVLSILLRDRVSWL